jgi:hypothetical protein
MVMNSHEQQMLSLADVGYATEGEFLCFWSELDSGELMPRMRDYQIEVVEEICGKSRSYEYDGQYVIGMNYKSKKGKTWTIQMQT